MNVATVAAETGLSRWLGLSRSELFAVTFALGFLNAIIPNIISGIQVYGIFYSVINTFEISVIVWLAALFAVQYALSGDLGAITNLDRAVCIFMLLVSVAPLGPIMWIFNTLFAFYLILGAGRSDMIRRCGWITLAITVPMFWSKRVFNVFSEFFLSLDAELVSSITGTSRISNLVPIPNGEGYLQIAAPCSSVANVSLAILCWVIFTQTTGVRWRIRNVAWCAFACISVVAINVSRISLIGFYPDKYELLHGPVGATVTSWLTIIVVLTVCFYGVGRGRFRLL